MASSEPRSKCSGVASPGGWRRLVLTAAVLPISSLFVRLDFSNLYHAAAQPLRDFAHLVFHTRNLRKLEENAAGAILHFDADLRNPFVLFRFFLHAQ